MNHLLLTNRILWRGRQIGNLVFRCGRIIRSYLYISARSRSLDTVVKSPRHSPSFRFDPSVFLCLFHQSLSIYYGVHLHSEFNHLHSDRCTFDCNYHNYFGLFTPEKIPGRGTSQGWPQGVARPLVLACYRLPTSIGRLRGAVSSFCFISPALWLRVSLGPGISALCSYQWTQQHPRGAHGQRNPFWRPPQLSQIPSTLLWRQRKL